MHLARVFRNTNGAPAMNRTRDNLITNQVLYPTELQSHISITKSTVLSVILTPDILHFTQRCGL